MKELNISNLEVGKFYVFQIEFDKHIYIGRYVYTYRNKIAIENINDQRVISLTCNDILKIYHYNVVSFIGLPFAYNGPCATIAGVGEIYNRLIMKYNEAIIFNLIKQNENQSAINYLDDILNLCEKSNIKNTVFMGGNHLSVLPLHKYAKNAGLCSIILDAHRDYSENLINEEITHANFLSYIEDLSNVVIYGYRDGKGQINSYNSCKTFCVEQEKQFFCCINELKKKGFQFYVDIDLDVLDPHCFPATNCPIHNGIIFENLMKIIEFIGFENIKYFSIEEYNPYLGDISCSDLIENIFMNIIKGWNIYDNRINNS